jgi:hypothetical protein
MKNYECSKHGTEGNPNCAECKAVLKELADDNNALLIGDFE